MRIFMFYALTQYIRIAILIQLYSPWATLISHYMTLYDLLSLKFLCRSAVQTE